jgi:DNA-binding IscR family transcriptional regulator
MFSKACEYGIRAILYIAAQSLQGNCVVLPEIARAFYRQDIPATGTCPSVAVLKV